MNPINTFVQIVLVETSHPGNIGSVARAMKNMGLSNLVLIKPKKFPHQEATALAGNATDILDRAQVFDSIEKAIQSSKVIYATSARERSIEWPILSAKDAASEIHSLAAEEIKVSILFGREDRGLTNEELGLCNFHVHIPTDPDYSSLNLAQAVQILVYEIRVASLSDTEDKNYWDVELANTQQTEMLINHMDELMQQVEFYDVDNPRKLLLRVRRFFKRSNIDVMEANIFRGLFATIQKKLKQ